MLCVSSRNRPLFRTRIVTCCAYRAETGPLSRTRITTCCCSLSQAKAKRFQLAAELQKQIDALGRREQAAGRAWLSLALQMTACLQCTPGYFSSARANACVWCGSGNVTDTLGSAGGRTCGRCAVGRVDHDNTSITACRACSAGSYSAGAGRTACVKCSPARYAPRSGLRSCGQCKAGSVTDTLRAPGSTRPVQTPSWSLRRPLLTPCVNAW